VWRCCTRGYGWGGLYECCGICYPVSVVPVLGIFVIFELEGESEGGGGGRGGVPVVRSNWNCIR